MTKTCIVFKVIHGKISLKELYFYRENKNAFSIKHLILTPGYEILFLNFITINHNKTGIICSVTFKHLLYIQAFPFLKL